MCVRACECVVLTRSSLRAKRVTEILQTVLGLVVGRLYIIRKRVDAVGMLRVMETYVRHKNCVCRGTACVIELCHDHEI